MAAQNADGHPQTGKGRRSGAGRCYATWARPCKQPRGRCERMNPIARPVAGDAWKRRWEGRGTVPVFNRALVSAERQSLDVHTLETWLWDAACQVRGPLDAPKFKDYILPLVLLKRLSDVFDDEVSHLAVAP